MEKHVIYKITSPSGKFYIGRTKNFKGRMNEHRISATVHDSQFRIHKAIRKYGWKAMKREIIAEVIGTDEAIYLESKLIEKYDTVNSGYNMTYNGSNGGSVWEGRYDSLEYLEFVDKMKKINKGENNGMFGKTHTESAKQKQKEKAKGRYSLPWFQERYGIDEGTRKYEERCLWLKNRKMPKGDDGKFIKKNM